MAGIMVSRDRNDSHFVGLAQDAYLHSWEWNGIVYDLDDMLFEMAYSQYPNLFVFASRFSYEKEGKDIRTEHGLLKDENVRLDHPLPARTIVDLRIPWITAVGQKENGPGIQFGLQSPMSPMNLGDQRNVIVVTACEDCNGSDARLWKNANYSEDGLVHVAAPGGKMIPGTAADGYYTQTKGTSQSAAYVGGLAAQMTACYPLYQGKPRLLKERLQVTSVPFPREEDRKKVTGGIIDPKKAMLDPKIHWLTQIGERETKIESIDWQIRRMEIFDADSNGRRFVDDIRTKRILRIMKFYPSTQGRDQWIFFVRAGLGNIIKKGPGALAEDQIIVRVRFENGGEAELMLGDIEDMLVKTTSD
jgi:hypothetical protein